MTSDFVRPPEQRYNYPNAISGLFTLVREEGPHALFRGMGTNLASALDVYPRLLILTFVWLSNRHVPFS